MRADLWNANLAGVWLWNANLSEANLEGVSLAGTDLSGASLCGTRVTKEILLERGALFDKYTVFGDE